jgi:2-polyprenyl-3-methyl-5-hydroxy-6-metoxy-1,4-benzoquinol methylase
LPLLSDYAQKKKINYFLEQIPKDAKILEIGAGSGWVGEFLKNNGWTNYIGLDIVPPADLVGDIKEWQKLGLKKNSFDYIIAFEVLEHVDCLRECHELLKEDGLLLVTTPAPNADWFLKILENVGLNQKRTSPHDNLVDLSQITIFDVRDVRLMGMLSQWGVFKK